ncbi:MAG: hypothetical protein QM784_35070 [Polyangiaceae bacterium]
MNRTTPFSGLWVLLVVGANACVIESGSSRRTASPPTPPLACTPNDPSWGCRGVASSQPASPMTQGVGTAPPVPPYTGTPAAAQPATVAAAPATAPPPIAPSAPTPVTPSTTPVATDDPLGREDVNYMRNRVSSVVSELIASLEPSLRSRVERSRSSSTPTESRSMRSRPAHVATKQPWP